MSTSEANDTGDIIKDHSFFEKLYTEHYASLVNYGKGILYDSHEAMDIVQEVFLDLWNKSDSLKIESSIKSYLYSCVKYKAFNRIKKLNIIDRHEEQLKEAYRHTLDTDGIPDSEINEEIKNILDAMPAQMRRILEYKNFYGWKNQEIAEELNISVNTVKTQLQRAYQRFRLKNDDNLIYSLLVVYLFDAFSR